MLAGEIQGGQDLNHVISTTHPSQFTVPKDSTRLQSALSSRNRRSMSPTSPDRHLELHSLEVQAERQV
jgi:hypothetical protein